MSNNLLFGKGLTPILSCKTMVLVCKEHRARSAYTVRSCSTASDPRSLTSVSCPKSKAFADNKINETQELVFVLRILENIVEKGKSAGY